MKQTCKNVSITPIMDHFIAAQVASGCYQNVSEVVRAAIRALQRKEAIEQERRMRLAAGVRKAEK